MTKLAGGVNCRQKQLSELLSLIKVDNYIFKGYIKLHYLVIAFVFSLFACTKSQQTSITQNNAEEFKIIGNKIYNYKNAIQLIGSNAFHVFGAGGSDLNSWNLDIAREFIGNVKEVPLSGFPIQDSNGSYLHSLQAIVDSNRLNKRITI